MTYNPKKYSRKSTETREAIFDFSNIANPISEKFIDPEDVLKTFSEWPLIPYAKVGIYSSQGLLKFLNSCRFISPTQGACHESIKSFAFGSKMRIKRASNIDFDIDHNDDLEKEIQKNFADFLKNSVELEGNVNYTNFSEKLFDSFKDNGNYLIEIVHSETLGVKKTYIYNHLTSNYCFYPKPVDGATLIALSPCWDSTYLRKNPPKFLPMYPFYKKGKDGELRTVLHVKNGNFKWFGRPDWVAAYTNCYREHQDCDYLTKMSANHFTGQVFIELEDDDIENDSTWEDDSESDILGRLEKNFTLKGGDPQTIMATTRPYGTKPAFIYQFKPVTNEKFFDTTSKLDRQKIIENNQWSERLLGNSVAEGYSNDQFIKELSVKDITVLKRYRTIVCYGLNIAIKEALKFNNITDFDNVEIGFNSCIKDLNEEEDE